MMMQAVGGGPLGTGAGEEGEVAGFILKTF